MVWTQQAEDDFRAKWPGRKCERVAGTEATYHGHTITKASSVYAPFAMRGWLKAEDEQKPVVMDPPEKSTNFKINANTMPKEKRIERWKTLQFWCRTCPDASLRFIANNMGLRSRQSLSNFCIKYGRELAKEMGKLGHLTGKGFDRGVWLTIMEQ